MDDRMNKLTELLADEESMQQIKELAEMLSSGADEEEQEENSESASSDSGMPDMELMMKLACLMGKLNERDENTELLMALRPHLSPVRQGRVDKAVKLLRLLAVYESAKESGLLSGINGW